MIKIIFLLLFSISAFAVGRIQNEDVKSRAEIIAHGGTDSQAINTTKLFVPMVTKIANYILSVTADEMVVANTSAGGFVLTLPAATNSGKIFRIKKVGIDINILTVAPNGLDTIEGETFMYITDPNVTVTLLSDGVSNWIIQ